MDTPFIKFLNKKMEELNMNQDQFAQFIDISPAALSNYLHGKREPTTKTINLIAKQLNVSVDYLLGMSNVSSVDKDIKFVCEYTGLSELAVNILHNQYEDDLNKIVSLLIEDDDPFDFEAAIGHKYRDKYQETHHHILSTINNFIAIKPTSDDFEITFDDEGNIFKSFDEQQEYVEAHDKQYYNCYTLPQNTVFESAILYQLTEDLKELRNQKYPNIQEEYDRLFEEDCKKFVLKYGNEGEQDEEQ